MKKLTLFIVMLFSPFLFSQKNKKEYDYIKDYYQLVYEAQYNYEIGNDTLAYSLLKKAESNCPLLNQENIREVNILAQLSMKLNKEKETFDYIELLLKKYGYSFFYFEGDSIYDSLKNKSRWKKLKKNSKKIFEKYKTTVNFELRNEIKLITAKDQEVRLRGIIDWKEVDSIDRIHEDRLKVIIKEFGYPDDNLIGSYALSSFDEIPPHISTLIMHIKDIDYWKPIFLDLIRRGKAPANIYGNLVDSLQRQTGMFHYGIYQNITPDRIIDFDKIDERRMAVGLSTWDLQKKMYDILMKEWENAN
jgi:hypothetical protein